MRNLILIIFALGAAAALPQSRPAPGTTVATGYPANLQDATPDRFFPLRLGDRWTYTVHGEQYGYSGKTVSRRATYSDTVIAIREVAPAIRVVELLRTGHSPGYAFCQADETPSGEGHVWYIVDHRNVYSRCNQRDLAALVQSLTKQPDLRPPTDSPDIVLPFKAGVSWGRDPDQPERSDRFYQWNVDTASNVKVPAGRFTGCFELTYRTLPDDEERVMCANAGLVADEYTHHGTTNHYRIELTRFSHAPRPAK